MNAIEISGLCKEYAGFTLQKMDLALPEGSIMGLVGENGAGKSTTIKLIMNAVSRAGGSVRVLGADNAGPEFCRLKDDVGVVLDEAYFPEVLSARNVGAIMRDTYSRWDAGLYAQYLSRFSLPEKKLFRDYSRGMRMKLAIAVALSHDPKLLILDEPTSGLDPMARDELLDLFNDFTRDAAHSILLSSHIVSDLEKICDYIAFLHQGRLALCEEKDRLLEEYAIVRLSQADFAAVPETAVVAAKPGGYGVEALIRSAEVSAAIPRERTSLEEIILFLARKDVEK